MCLISDRQANAVFARWAHILALLQLFSWIFLKIDVCSHVYGGV